MDISGTVLKWLFGNMDREDAQEVYGHLNNLDKNTDQITD